MTQRRSVTIINIEPNGMQDFQKRSETGSCDDKDKLRKPEKMSGTGKKGPGGSTRSAGPPEASSSRSNQDGQGQDGGNEISGEPLPTVSIDGNSDDIGVRQRPVARQTRGVVPSSCYHNNDYPTGFTINNFSNNSLSLFGRDYPLDPPITYRRRETDVAQNQQSFGHENQHWINMAGNQMFWIVVVIGVTVVIICIIFAASVYHMKK